MDLKYLSRAKVLVPGAAVVVALAAALVVVWKMPSRHAGEALGYADVVVKPDTFDHVQVLSLADARMILSQVGVDSDRAIRDMDVIFYVGDDVSYTLMIRVESPDSARDGAGWVATSRMLPVDLGGAWHQIDFAISAFGIDPLVADRVDGWWYSELESDIGGETDGFDWGSGGGGPRTAVFVQTGDLQRLPPALQGIFDQGTDGTIQDSWAQAERAKYLSYRAADDTGKP